MLAFADTLLLFAASAALAGVFRALDSGPLNAWYVDETIAAGRRDEVARGISGGASAIGLSIAAGAVVAGGTAAGAIYETLLHDYVDGDHRATVLSLASMAMQPAGSLGAIVLGLIATEVSTSVAIIVGGVVLAMAAPLFLVKEREGAGQKV